MKIAIAGGGMAGSYLAQLLQQNGHCPDVYDGMEHDTSCGCRSCGWGAPAGIGRYLDNVGLDLNEYLLEPMPSMIFDSLEAKTPLLTIEKPRLIRDLRLGLTLKRQNLGIVEARDYDVLVDATGITRSLLPPCSSDLTLPTLQHRVVVDQRVSGRLPAGVPGVREERGNGVRARLQTRRAAFGRAKPSQRGCHRLAPAGGEQAYRVLSKDGAPYGCGIRHKRQR